MYKEGFQWVVASDSEEATQNLVDSFVQFGIQYKQYGTDEIAIRILQVVLDAKKSLDFENKDVLVGIVEEGLERLQ